MGERVGTQKVWMKRGGGRRMERDMNIRDEKLY